MRLHSGAPFWLLKNGLEELCTPPPARATVDVAVVGAGITGALVADALSAEGLAVVVLDRRAPASGSTAASTALISYEIDVELHRLMGMVGEADAVRAYRLSAASIDTLAGIAASLGEPCGFARRPSLYLATKKRHAGSLRREVEVRQRYGLDVEYWPREQVEAVYGFASHGALRTAQAAVLDPVRFTRALLRRAVRRGTALLARTAVWAIREDRGCLVLDTEGGELRARWVVYAMGYEMP
ncbi:MAG: NAD(P)/FAD-dependent oxidoreductase, partial [Gemmatimonadales bacterium]